jgi:hypothetical protein
MLTTNQLKTLRIAVAANATANGYMTAGDIPSLWQWLNADASPVVPAWKISYPPDSLYKAHKPVEYIARSAAERSAFDLMCRFTVDPSINRIRTGIEDIFSGVQNSTSRPAILNDMLENTSNAENALGGNTVTTAVDSISGLKRNWVGDVTMDEASRIPFAV